MLWCVWCDGLFFHNGEGSMRIPLFEVDNFFLKLIDLCEMLEYELCDDMWVYYDKENVVPLWAWFNLVMSCMPLIVLCLNDKIVVDLHYSWFLCIWYELLHCLMNSNVYRAYVWFESYCILDPIIR